MHLRYVATPYQIQKFYISYSFFKANLVRDVQWAIFLGLRSRFSQLEVYEYVLEIHHCKTDLVYLVPNNKSNPKSVYFLEKERKNTRDHLCSFKQEISFTSTPTEVYNYNIIIPFGNILFPMQTTQWLHLFLYFSTEYHDSGQSIRGAFGTFRYFQFGGWIRRHASQLGVFSTCKSRRIQARCGGGYYTSALQIVSWYLCVRLG